MTINKKLLGQPLNVILSVYLLFVVFALIIDTPIGIINGLGRIITSRSVLITDYMAIGGMGATLVNAAMVGTIGIFGMKRLRVNPTGSHIMALWVTTGFAMFGKNIYNMMPLIIGLWIFSKVKKEPFSNFTLVALMSATCSPVVSETSFHPMLHPAAAIPAGILLGMCVGFIFPVISAFTVRIHGGYDLYNMGFAGGLISTFIVSFAVSLGIPMENELHWSSDFKLQLAILLYLVSALLIILGLYPDGKFTPPKYYKELITHHGRSVSDFYVMFKEKIYFNMGVLCAAATTLILIIGADLNGPMLAGIFTIVGFGAFGKHLRNCSPIVAGALICTILYRWEFTSPQIALAILFCTSLAPISGQFGWIWGIVAGFLHVNTVMHIGFLNSGLNLYNNGYAAGFVALILIPIILAFTPERKHEDEKSANRKGHAHHK